MYPSIHRHDPILPDVGFDPSRRTHIRKHVQFLKIDIYLVLCTPTSVQSLGVSINYADNYLLPGFSIATSASLSEDHYNERLEEYGSVRMFI